MWANANKTAWSAFIVKLMCFSVFALNIWPVNEYLLARLLLRTFLHPAWCL